MFDITGFYRPQKNLSSFKIKGLVLFEDLQHFQRKHVLGFTCFSDPQDRGYSGEKHYENMRWSTMENPTNVSDAYEVGARHSLTHWGSNHEQGTPGPCPPWSPSLVEMIRCYKRCCEEEVLRVIVAKPNLGFAHPHAVESIYCPGCGEEVQLLPTQKCQARSPGQLEAQNTPRKFPDRFQKSSFKDKNWGGSPRVGDQLVNISLIDGEGIEQCHKGLTWSILRSRNYIACGHQVVNFLHLVVVLASVKRTQEMCIRYY